MTDYPEYQSLLRAVCECPEDDLPRLVLADWLDEHSSRERAEFIRASVAAGSGGENGWTLQPHVHHPRRELFLVGGLRPDQYLYRRGFVDAVTLTAAVWLREADRVFWHPNQVVPCGGCNGLAAAGLIDPIDPPCRLCSGEGSVGRPFVPTAQPVREVRLTTLPDDVRDLAPYGTADSPGVWRSRRWPGVRFTLS